MLQINNTAIKVKKKKKRWGEREICVPWWFQGLGLGAWGLIPAGGIKIPQLVAKKTLS